MHSVNASALLTVCVLHTFLEGFDIFIDLSGKTSKFEEIEKDLLTLIAPLKSRKTSEDP